MHARAEHRGWSGGVLFEDHPRAAVVLRIGRPFGPEQVQYLHSIGGAEDYHVAPISEDPGTAGDLTIREDVARLLFEILLAHYGGPGPGRELRADYVAERARVDKLIDAVIMPPRIISAETATVLR